MGARSVRIRAGALYVKADVAEVALYFANTDLMLFDSNGSYGNVLCEPDMALHTRKHFTQLPDAALI